MASNAFLQGFMQGFNKAGGTQKASSWVGRNIAEGEYYNPQNDPIYQRDLQRARELGTPAARQQVANKYSQYVDTGDQSPQEYFFQPAEGTPQAMELRQAQQALEQGEQAIEKGNIQLDYMKPQLEQQLRSGELSNKTAAEQLGQLEIKGEYLEPQLELDIAGRELGLESDQFQLDRAQEMAPIEQQLAETNLEQQQFQLGQAKDMAPIEQQMAQTQLNQQQFNLGQAQDMAPIELQTAQENLNRLTTQNQFLEQELENQLDLQEQQLIGQKLNNQMNELQLEKGRKLLPLEVEQLKNNIYSQELQNRSAEIQNKYQPQLYENELEQAELTLEQARQQGNNFDIPGDWDPIGKDKWANTNQQVYLDPGNFLRYPDGSYVADKEGNYWTWDGNNKEYTTVNPGTDLNIPAYQNQQDAGPAWWQNLLRLAPGGKQSEWTQNTPQGNETQQTTSTSSMNDIIQMYKERYPDYSNDDIKNMLQNQSDEWKQKFEQNYGLPVNSVIDRLNMMR